MSHCTVINLISSCLQTYKRSALYSSPFRPCPFLLTTKAKAMLTMMLIASTSSTLTMKRTKVTYALICATGWLPKSTSSSRTKEIFADSGTIIKQRFSIALSEKASTTFLASSAPTVASIANRWLRFMTALFFF